MRREALIAAVVVVVASVAGRLLASSFSLYLEPWGVTRQGHLWQLLTWIPTGASLTFLADAALLFFALSRGVSVKLWLGATFGAGALSALMAFIIPAVLSCTFAGAGVGATACLWAFSRSFKGKQRWAWMLVAFIPAVLDGVVDGSYALMPHLFALPLASGFGRVTARR